MRITECFSILVTSGFGHRCGNLKKILHNRLLAKDPTTQEILVDLHKLGKDGQSSSYQALSKQLAHDILPLFKDVDKKYFLKPNSTVRN